MSKLMRRLLKGHKGFSLVELAIVMAIMGVLAAIVVPNVTGFLSKGAEESWKGDQNQLQTAIDSFRTDSRNIGGKYPTLANFALPTPYTGTQLAIPDTATNNDCEGGKGIGGLVGGCNPRINYAALVNGVDLGGGQTIPGGFLRATDAVKSQDKTNNASATNSLSGSYDWYVDSTGSVTSEPTFSGTYP